MSFGMRSRRREGRYSNKSHDSPLMRFVACVENVTQWEKKQANTS